MKSISLKSLSFTSRNQLREGKRFQRHSLHRPFYRCVLLTLSVAPLSGQRTIFTTWGPIVDTWRSGRPLARARHSCPASGDCRVFHCRHRVSHPTQKWQRSATHPVQSGGRPSTASLRCSKSWLGISRTLASPGFCSSTRR